MKVEIELPDPDEGFEYTGEYRCPEKGDWFLDIDGQIHQAKTDFAVHFYPILKPVEKWIVPTLEYMQKHYKWGEFVEARFRDTSNQEWKYGDLIFINTVKLYAYVASPGNHFNFCEIKEVSKK